MDIKVYYNPEELLSVTGFYWLWNFVFAVILIGLTISFVTEVFKLQKKGNPDFWGVAWKTIIIILLYKYLPGILGSTVGYINSMSGTANLDQAFYKTFEILSGNLNQVAPDSVPDNCVTQDVSWYNVTVGYVMAQTWNFIARFTLFVCIIIAWVVKEMIFTWAWPTLVSINMLGLCIALVIPAFPGQGFGSIGSFLKSVMTLMLWPVMYTIFMFIVGNALQYAFVNLQATLACPSSYEFSRATVLAMTGCLFMGYGIKSIPKKAEAIMNHRGMGQVGGGAAMVAGAMVVNAANKVSNGSGTLAQGAAKGLSKAGGGLMDWGRKLQGGSGGEFKAPQPSGHTLASGQKGYSMTQAQNLVSQVSSKDPEKGKELGNKLKQAQNINSGRGFSADKNIKNNAYDSVAKDAINFLGGDKKK